MPAPPPPDRDSLIRLREWVRRLHAHDGAALPIDELRRFAGDVRLDGGVTIDFEASRDLGQPMVVLHMAAGDRPAACIERLSRREREVASLIADGLSNKQIAARLCLALPTVKDHVHHILAKTGLANRAAVAVAVRGRLGDAPSGTP